MWYVYKHIRLDKNEPFYIGIGQTSCYRRAHSKSKRNKYWKNITNISPYAVEILLDNLSLEEARKKEIEFISLYGRADLGKGPLCNMTDGGEGTLGILVSEEKRKYFSEMNRKYKHTPEAIAKIKEATLNMSEETKKKMSNSRLGKKRSPETIEKMRLAGKNISEETRLKRALSRSGKKHSEEAKLKMSEKAKLRNLNKTKNQNNEVQQSNY